MSPGYAWFQKQSLEYHVIKVWRKPRRKSLSQKMWFLTEASFEILRPQLDSWCQNESGGSLRFWFRVPVGSTRKTMQLNWQFPQFILKNVTFLHTAPNIGNIYQIEPLRETNWDIPLLSPGEDGGERNGRSKLWSIHPPCSVHFSAKHHSPPPGSHSSSNKKLNHRPYAL